MNLENKDEKLPFELGEIRNISLPKKLDQVIFETSLKEGRSYLGMLIHLLCLGYHCFSFDPSLYLDDIKSDPTGPKKVKKSVPLSVRFEVFKRDGFTCQYCGKKPPEAVLEVDHVTPESKGGTNTIENFKTSCFECNRGKGSKE
jgi:hypothetical protein